MATHSIITNGQNCSSECTHYTIGNSRDFCTLFKKGLNYSPTEATPYRCTACCEIVPIETNVTVEIECSTEGFLKEPVRNPTDKCKPLYGPPKKPTCEYIGGSHLEENASLNLYPFVLLVGIMLIILGWCIGVGHIALLGLMVVILGIVINIGSPFSSTNKSHPILDNLTQPEAALCAKIIKLPNKNKLIKQCKEYAQTLMNSKTDQPIEPLLTKLYNICEAQLNVGLKENVREIECFISAIEEVESRSLNNEEN